MGDAYFHNIASRGYLLFLLKRSKCSQKSLASHIETSPPSISMMISGRMDIPILRVTAICTALGGNPRILMALVMLEQYPDLFSMLGDLSGRAKINPD